MFYKKTESLDDDSNKVELSQISISKSTFQNQSELTKTLFSRLYSVETKDLSTRHLVPLDLGVCTWCRVSLDILDSSPGTVLTSHRAVPHTRRVSLFYDRTLDRTLLMLFCPFFKGFVKLGISGKEAKEYYNYLS